jgi:integrase
VVEVCRARHLDLLINNAGVAYYGPFAKIPPERADEIVRVNTLAVVSLSRAAVEGMVARGRGAIVNVASLLALSGATRNPQTPLRAIYAGIVPGIENRAMTSVAREDIEAIVSRLDSAVAAFQKHGPGKGRLSPSTAANVWGDLPHAFDEAVTAKDPNLRVLTSNPVREVRPPETGTEREGPILFSDELVALLRGTPVERGARPVPLYRRQVYAIATYTKARSSELEALTVGDVDLIHGTITIEKQSDPKSKGRTATKATKTKRARTIDIEPNVRPLVEWLVKHPQGKGGRLLHMPPPEDRPELLRRDLVHVGITRKVLHIEGDPLRRALVFHDLRDTGLTHMAVRGDAPIAIQWAGGHTDFKTTQGYIDKGRVEARRIGAPLPPLPPELIDEESPRIARGAISSHDSAKNKVFWVTPAGIEPALPA